MLNTTMYLGSLGRLSLSWLSASSALLFDQTNELVTSRRDIAIPANAQYIPPSSFAVLPLPFGRNASTPWLPPNTSASQPFQIFHSDFLNIIGSSPRLRIIASNPDYWFAHEAAIWLPYSDEFLFCANAGPPQGRSGLNQTNKVFKIRMDDIGSNTVENITVTELDIQPPLENTNGGTRYGDNSVIFAAEGRGADIGGGIYQVSTNGPPYESKGIVNSFYGRQFNSPNDVVVHPADGAIFFTDTTYGYVQDFRPPPALPDQVYRFDPKTGAIKAVADGFGHVNGIVLSPNGKKAYVSDTAQIDTERRYNLPASIYEFDILFSRKGQTQSFVNRRLFAYADTGVPDGLKVDRQGNVYAGAGDGIHVWNSEGTLLGKVFINKTSANFAFAGPGKIVILAETEVYLAEISQGIEGVL